VVQELYGILYQRLLIVFYNLGEWFVATCVPFPANATVKGRLRSFFSHVSHATLQSVMQQSHKIVHLAQHVCMKTLR